MSQAGWRSVMVRAGQALAPLFDKKCFPAWEVIGPSVEASIDDARSCSARCYNCRQPLQECDDHTTFIVEIGFDEHGQWVDGDVGCGACCAHCSRLSSLRLWVELADQKIPPVWTCDWP
jgi:Pyruvate/2-oxoacid:ferredoxin oxidoreductase delta subunit